MDGRTRGTTVDRGTRSGVRRTGTCRRRRQAAQNRLGRRETAIDPAVGGAHPRWAPGRGVRCDRNSRAGVLESCTPEAYSERQLEELDRLIEPWLDDYERTSRAVRN